jgi:hypothetical protein
MGATHQYILDTPSTAAAARVHADRCTTPHTDLSKVTPLTADELAELGILHTATWATADTQPLSRQDIAEGLATRAAADAETAKEHPQP